MDGIFQSFRRSKKAKDQGSHSTPTHANGWSTPDSHSSGQRINDGVYIITNKYHHRFVSLEDPNGTNLLKGDFMPGNRNAQWHVKHYGNDQYSIENVEHNRYADSGSRAMVKARVEGSSQERQWRIQVLLTGEYTIAATDTSNLWMLPSDIAKTPVELSNVYTDQRCWWTFEKLDTDSEVLNSELSPVPRSLSYSPRISHYQGSSHGDSPVRRYSRDGSHSPHIFHTSSLPSLSQRGETDVVHEQGSPRSGRSRARSRSASPIIVPATSVHSSRSSEGIVMVGEGGESRRSRRGSPRPIIVRSPNAQRQSRSRSRSRSPVIIGGEPRRYRRYRASLTGDARRHRSRSPRGPSERPRISQPNIIDGDGRGRLLFMDRTLGGRSRTPTRVITTGSRRSRSYSPQRRVIGRPRSRSPPITINADKSRSHSRFRRASVTEFDRGNRSPRPVIVARPLERPPSSQSIIIDERRSRGLISRIFGGRNRTPTRVITTGGRISRSPSPRPVLGRGKSTTPPISIDRDRPLSRSPRRYDRRRERSPPPIILTGRPPRSYSPGGRSRTPPGIIAEYSAGYSSPRRYDSRRVRSPSPISRGFMSRIFGGRSRTPTRVITTESHRARSRSPRRLFEGQRSRTPSRVITSYSALSSPPSRYDSHRVRSPSPISVHGDRPRSPSPTRIIREPGSPRRSRSQSPTRIVMQDVTDPYSGGQRAPDLQPRGDPINSGIYTITNVHHKFFVYLEDANDKTPLRGHHNPENRSARWQVKQWKEGKYSIENVDHKRYANCGSRAALEAFVDGHDREQLWRIQARPTGEYTITTTDTGNLWMLPDAEPDTPVKLSNVHNDRRCWWIFQKQEIEALENENPMTEPVLFEPEPPVALAQIPSIPGDTDLEVPESEPYLAKHFGIHVPNLSGQVWRLKKGTVFSGTFSVVYPGMYGDKKVAIKMLRMTKQGDKIERKFRRELLIWSRLQHVNVLPLYGYFEDKEDGDGFPSLVSKWAEHGSAAQYITRDLRWDQRTSLFYDVAKGLNYLHGFEPLIVHADLKPQNVVVNINGVGQLCDFGLTRFTQDGLETGLTTTTAHTGTVRYLAYELVDYEDEPVPTAATDMYALGCLGLEFIYRIPPHASLRANYGKIIRAIGGGLPPAKRPANPEEVVSMFWDLVEACWINTPEERPTATQISDYLEKSLEALSESLERCSWAPEYPNR